MKNRMTVALNAPYFSQRLPGSSSLSGSSSHSPTAIKLIPTAHFATSGDNSCANHTPNTADTR